MPYTAGKSNGINWTISSKSNDIPRVETCKQFGSAPLCFNQKVNELSVVYKEGFVQNEFETCTQYGGVCMGLPKQELFK